ncbi:GNAT family N-acetyltransferase [Neomegalonema perideroedes]|uniref:GNAT family N-acetyltransferase n=1 Tax=Neomegalonema perideroedes TaxID=217219 RepID=UPI00035E2ABC|nr:GNAT family protein [Neomegalonema perideroedes]
MFVRRLTPEDLEAYQALRLRALREEPAHFGASFEEESARPPEFWRARLEPAGDLALFGGFAEDRMVGLSGIWRESSPRRRHLAALVHVYLTPDQRGRGLASGLVEAALDHARSLPGLRAVHLDVMTQNAAARALYARLGFAEIGLMPEAHAVEGRFYDDVLMRLAL